MLFLPMKKIRCTFYILLIMMSGASCNKRVCPDYLQNPDCNIESRSRFYGIYKGISLLDTKSPVTTQWGAGPGGDISEIIISANMTLLLDPKDTRVFRFKEGSFMDGNQYIRNDGYDGRFTDDSLYFDFWTAEGVTVTPGEKRNHYIFAGKKK